MSLFHLNYLIFQKYDKKDLKRIVLAASWEEQLEYIYYRALLFYKVLIHGYVYNISFLNMRSYLLHAWTTNIQLIICVMYILATITMCGIPLSFATGEPIPLEFKVVLLSTSNSY